MSRTKADRGKISARNIIPVSDFKKTPFLKKINPPAAPEAKKMSRDVQSIAARKKLHLRPPPHPLG